MTTATSLDGVGFTIAFIQKKTIYDDDDFETIKRDNENCFKQQLRGFSFYNCVIFDFPKADVLLKDKPNYDCLGVIKSKITRIRSLDLEGFEQLILLHLDYNDIEELPSDLFIHTPNLQFIRFISNKIKFIGENILEPLKNLKAFNLSENPGIDALYDRELAGKNGNPTLAQFKKLIKQCKPVQNVWNNVNEFKKLKAKFEAQQKEMMREITDLKKLCVDQSAKIKGQKKAIDDIKKHCDALEKKLEEAKQDGAFQKFDFTIKINEKTFKVQKEILAANSQLLANLIRNNEDADTLELKDISEEVFEDILNFMVKKTQPKATANFIEIYAASGRLQMKELMDLCARILMGNITQENAWEIFGLCRKYPNKELGKKAIDEMNKMYKKT